MKVVRGLGLLVLLALVVLLLSVGRAQWFIRSIEPELPEASQLTALDTAVDGPVRLSLIETARQKGAAPPPEELSHPSYVLEWADGRLLLVDLGMTPAAAKAFGEPFELLGSPPTETFGSVAEQLGEAVDRVGGVVITHLHTDHLEGGTALCPARKGKKVPMFQVPAQAELRNYTTSLSDPVLAEADCLVSTPVTGTGLTPIPGFPGVGLIHAAGHTPGSQMLAASIGPPGQRERWIFTGDVINDAAAAAEDRPKALLYRLLIVPENDGQLSRVRQFLAGLAQNHSYELAVAHDGLRNDDLDLPGFGEEPEAP